MSDVSTAVMDTAVMDTAVVSPATVDAATVNAASMSMADSVAVHSLPRRFDHYMLLVSEHNVAELRACLYWQPKHIYLVITDRVTVAAKRLYTVLSALLPNSQIISLTHTPEHPLTGERLQPNEQWIDQVVRPLFATLDLSQCAFNFTGSTKSLAFLLMQAFDWAELHYQPYDQTNTHLWLERMRWQDGKTHHLPAIDLAAYPLDLYHAVGLYIDNAEPDQPNRIFEHPDSLALAELRLAAQSLSTDSADNPWTVLTPLLDQIWYRNDYPSHQKTVLIKWQDCALERAVLQLFLQRLAALDAKHVLLSFDDEGFSCPTSHHKHVHSWRKWIGGDWYEQLIQHWLRQGGVADQDLAAGLKIMRENDQGREVDILLMHKQSLHVIEIKADVPKGDSIGKFEEQLSSTSNALGKVKKFLVLAPAIQHKLSEAQRSAFELRCKNNQVEVIYAGQAQDLRKLLP